MKYLNNKLLFWLSSISILMLTSCDISDDYESFSESFYPDFKINNVSGKDLWNPHPDIGLRIDEIHNIKVR
jgi:Zn-dependent protease with chaperone function